VSPGDLVAADAVLADIIDEEGRAIEQVRSPWPARVMMLRRTAVIQAGDGVAMLAPYSRAPAMR
jgi:predicted deacylase